jgi:uncharacterized protein YifE (UPF0438 family)
LSRSAAPPKSPCPAIYGARLEEGDYLEAEVTEAGAILLKPVSIGRREPSPAQEAEILAVVDQERNAYAAERRR